MTIEPIRLTVDDNPDVPRAIERDLRRQCGKNFTVLRAEAGAGSTQVIHAYQSMM